jgi:hypothetical protein
MRTFLFHVYEEMKNGYTIKVIQAKNVIKGVFIYMEYLYRKNKYKKVIQKTIKIIMCLRRFLCRNWFQFIKVKFAFHIIMYIITKSNNQGATKSSPCKQTFTCEINCWMFSGIPTRADVGNNYNLPQMWIGMNTWTCLGQIKFRNANFVICSIASTHLPSMVNNMGSSLVAMEAQRKLDFLTFDFEW